MSTQHNKLAIMHRAEVYWTAQAMQKQGSRFFQHLGAALQAADLANRQRILESWPVECWDFYQRGLALARREQE